MGKDPAVLWYWNDWQGGTMTLTRHQKGCYMDLLSAQFNTGRLSLESIKTVLGSDFGPAWPAIQKKFQQDEHGLFFNERLEQEKSNRKVFSKNQSDRANKRWHGSGNATALPKIENENEIEIKDEVKKGVLRGKKFLAEEIQDLPPTNFGAVRQLLKISKGIEAADDEISGLWEIFKVQNLTGEKYYKSQNDVYSHFFNWINGKKINGTNRQPVKHSVKTAGAYALLEKLRSTAGGKANP